MEPRDRDQIDRLLDRVLEQYGRVEPRPGLENRILARVQAQASRSRRAQQWAWSLGGAAAAALLLMMWSGIRHGSVGSPENTMIAKAPGEARDSVQPARSNPAHAPSLSHRRTSRVQRSRVAGRTLEPRLDQFPSRLPLSQRELALADYVQQFPDEAMLVANQQSRFEEEIRNAEKEFEQSTSGSEKER